MVFREGPSRLPSLFFLVVEMKRSVDDNNDPGSDEEGEVKSDAGVETTKKTKTSILNVDASAWNPEIREVFFGLDGDDSGFDDYADTHPDTPKISAAVVEETQKANIDSDNAVSCSDPDSKTSRGNDEQFGGSVSKNPKEGKERTNSATKPPNERRSPDKGKWHENREDRHGYDRDSKRRNAPAPSSRHADDHGSPSRHINHHNSDPPHPNNRESRRTSATSTPGSNDKDHWRGNEEWRGRHRHNSSSPTRGNSSREGRDRLRSGSGAGTTAGAGGGAIGGRQRELIIANRERRYPSLPSSRGNSPAPALPHSRSNNRGTNRDPPREGRGRAPHRDNDMGRMGGRPRGGVGGGG